MEYVTKVEYCDEFWKLYDAWRAAVERETREEEKKAWQVMQEHKAQCDQCRQHDEQVD